MQKFQERGGKLATNLNSIYGIYIDVQSIV